jgi:hypothetical protein
VACALGAWEFYTTSERESRTGRGVAVAASLGYCGGGLFQVEPLAGRRP